MIEFWKTSQSYKAAVYSAMAKAVLTIILNAVATTFLLKNNRKSRQQCHNSTAGSRRNEIILMSLCITNVLFGIGILVDFGAFICEKSSTVGFLLITFSLILSLTHIILLTFERIVAARFPFKYQLLNTKYLLIALVVIWVLSIGIAAATINSYNTFLLVFCVVVLCSNVAVVVTYVYIIYKIRYSSKRLLLPATSTNSTPWYSNEQKEQQNRVTTLCCIIVLVYITTTLPCVICYIIPKYGVYSTPFSGEVKEMVLFLLLIWRSMTDPLIYIFREQIYKRFAFVLSMAIKKSEINNNMNASSGSGALLSNDDSDVMTRV